MPPHRPRFHQPFFGLAAAVVILTATGAHGMSAFDDDFADGVAGPQWSIVTDSPGELSLLETGGQLTVLANAPTSPNTDALYLSNGPAGFRLATDTDFRITLDYTFTNFNSGSAAIGDLLGLTFGVGRDLDGTDAAAIGFAASIQSLGGFPLVGTALGEAHRIDDVQTDNILNLLGPETGAFAISYDAAGDDLTLGVGALTFTLEDTVRTVWAADALFVSFGVRGNGFSLVPGDATLDNFTIDTGRVVPLCIPGDYNGDGFVSQADLDLVLLSWGASAPPPGWVKPWPPEGEPFPPIISQNELDAVLLNWGSGQTLSDTLTVPEPAAASAVCVIGLFALRRHRA